MIRIARLRTVREPTVREFARVEYRVVDAVPKRLV